MDAARFATAHWVVLVQDVGLVTDSFPAARDIIEVRNEPVGNDAGPATPTTVFDCNESAKTPANAGCSFYAAHPPSVYGQCYAVFVVNLGTQPAKLLLNRGSTAFNIAQHAFLPRGSGQNLRYEAFNETAGLAPNDLAIIFLSGPAGLGPGYNACPAGVQSAVKETTEAGRDDSLGAFPRYSSGMGTAFHLRSDRPVVAYDITPSGGANSVLTSPSLLLSEESWGRNYVIATPPYQKKDAMDINAFPTYFIVVAGQDATEVSFRPAAAVAGAPGIPASDAGQVVRLRLDAGDFAQISEVDNKPLGFTTGLSGSFLESTKPVAVVGGSPCLSMPARRLSCDTAHQQIPPFGALGHEYVAVRYRSRLPKQEEPVPWQILGAVNGTELSYSPGPPTPDSQNPLPAPTTIRAGEVVHFWTAEPFVVRSQDANHPFYLAAYMTGTETLRDLDPTYRLDAGDPDFVNVVPTEQYSKDYTFLTDPTYPETSLVVVRRPNAAGAFADVRLACANAPLTGWIKVGTYEFKRLDLVTNRFTVAIPGCANGRHRMSSDLPFAVTVWGWGSTMVPGTDYVSYGYPAGSALGKVNTAPPPIVVEYERTYVLKRPKEARR
jgi:hypothetical protein